MVKWNVVLSDGLNLLIHNSNMPQLNKKTKNKWYRNIWVWFFLWISIILFSAFLLEFKLVGQAVYGDARYYMGFTRSLYFNQNVDISDEMYHYWSPESNNSPAGFESVPSWQKSIKDTTYNFSLGISVIWLPIYFLADMLVLILSKSGFYFVRNGYSDPYQIILGFGNIFFVLSGLIILSKLLLQYYSKRTVVISIILITPRFNFRTHGWE